MRVWIGFCRPRLSYGTSDFPGDRSALPSHLVWLFVASQSALSQPERDAFRLKRLPLETVLQAIAPGQVQPSGPAVTPTSVQTAPFIVRVKLIVQSDPTQNHRRSAQASKLQTGKGTGAAAPAGRSHKISSRVRSICWTLPVRARGDQRKLKLRDCSPRRVRRAMPGLARRLCHRAAIAGDKNNTLEWRLSYPGKGRR